MNKLTINLRACLLDLEEYHGRVDGWRPSSDAAPYLYFVYLKSGKVITRDIGLAPWVWEQRSTIGDFLWSAAQMMHEDREVLSLLIPNDFIGLVGVFEGWGLSKEEDRDIERIAKSRRIHLHPDRRENRMVIGTLLASSTIHAVIRYRRRNQIMWCPDDEGEGSLTGGIPEGLRHMADVMLGTLGTKPTPAAYQRLREIAKSSPKLAAMLPDLNF